MHCHEIHDGSGYDLIDVIPFCCDSCHREWCEDNGQVYGGWNGCQESGRNEWCAECGVRVSLDFEGDCDWHCLPIVVNLIAPVDTVCEHGVRDYITIRKEG